MKELTMNEVSMVSGGLLDCDNPKREPDWNCINFKDGGDKFLGDLDSTLKCNVFRNRIEM